MSVVTGSRHREVVDVTHGPGNRGMGNAVVMQPGPNLRAMPISEWACRAGASLRAGLQLLLKSELIRQRKLYRNVLDGRRRRTHALCRKESHADQKQHTTFNGPEPPRFQLCTSVEGPRTSHQILNRGVGSSCAQCRAISLICGLGLRAFVSLVRSTLYRAASV